MDKKKITEGIVSINGNSEYSEESPEHMKKNRHLEHGERTQGTIMPMKTMKEI